MASKTPYPRLKSRSFNALFDDPGARPAHVRRDGRVRIAGALGWGSEPEGGPHGPDPRSASDVTKISLNNQQGRMT